MLTMKRLANFLAATAVTIACGAAHADFLFSGSGTSGNLAPAAEPWTVLQIGGVPTWGSPGVGLGIVPYSRAIAAYGFDIDFGDGVVINRPSVTIGNGANCAGSAGGGTTFCTVSPIDIWIATVLDDNSIAFRAQNPTFFVSPGQNYFVNIFFTAASAQPTSFTGRWLTDFAPTPVPEPTTLALLGLALTALARTQRRKTAAA